MIFGTRACDWQSQGQRFDPAMLHKITGCSRLFYLLMYYYVYIIQSEVDQSLYIGQTQDLIKRLFKHNRGYSIYTRQLRPWKLYAYKRVNLRKEAMKLERKLKNLKTRERIIEFAINNRFSFNDISD